MTAAPRDVVVIGGGIAGLAAARDLRAAGLDVELFERSHRVGGWIRSESREGRIVEWGPQSVVATRPDFHDFVREVGLDGDIELARPSTKARFIFSRGRRHRLVPHPLALLFGSALGVRGKLRAITERFRKSSGPEHETLAEFSTRRFGAEVTERLIAPFALGVHATTPDRLELVSCFPALAQMESEHGSVLRALTRRASAKGSGAPRGPYTLRGGLESLPRAIADELGDRVHTGVEVRTLVREGSLLRLELDSGESITAKRAIIATPPDAAASLLAELNPAAASLLQEIEFAPVRLVECRIDPRTLAGARDLDGFGVLAAPAEGVPVLGAVFASSLFESRRAGDRESLVVFIGGTVRPDLVEDESEAWRDATRDGLRVLLECPQLEVEIVESRAYARAIPIPAPGHAERIRRLREALLHEPVALAGNYLEGVSLHAAIASGRAAAATISDPESTPERS